MGRALVFSIEEFSLFDGPGIRTTVFLKGCPLRCEWCHNPEGQSFSNSILRSLNGCIGCGRCTSYAELVDGAYVFTEKSLLGCPRRLLRYCAEEYEASELCARLQKNLELLNASGGGVTFSGGEPTANGEFLIECLSLLEGKTHRAVQTSGFCSEELFARVLDNCDYLLYDIKLVDAQEHKKYTGVSNELILGNFRALAACGKDFTVRTPLIPTVTDTEENIRAIARLLYENRVKKIELLPYNRMAGAKYSLVGKEYSPSFDGSLDVAVHSEIFAEYGIKCKIL